jgi:hypothetical protein
MGAYMVIYRALTGCLSLRLKKGQVLYQHVYKIACEAISSGGGMGDHMVNHRVNK